MTLFYLKLCYNEMCYKGSSQFSYYHDLFKNAIFLLQHSDYRITYR